MMPPNKHPYDGVITVADFIAAFRKKQKVDGKPMSQRAFAESFGFTPAYIGRLETGTPKMPTEFIKAIYPLLDSTEREILKTCIVNTTLEGIDDGN